MINTLVYTNAALIGLYHPLDGITNPKYKLKCFSKFIFFSKRKRH